MHANTSSPSSHSPSPASSKSSATSATSSSRSRTGPTSCPWPTAGRPALGRFRRRRTLDGGGRRARASRRRDMASHAMASDKISPSCCFRCEWSSSYRAQSHKEPPAAQHQGCCRHATSWPRKHESMTTPPESMETAVIQSQHVFCRNDTRRLCMIFTVYKPQFCHVSHVMGR